VDPREQLRIALQGTGCARCGRTYAAQGITVLAQREGIAFVQLVCLTCQAQTLALVTGAPLEAGPIRAGEAGSMNEADVLEMRSFLADYEGDVTGMFEAGRRAYGDADESAGDTGGRA
jgi:hypothetical protein